ncbi:MAG: hypothetical protein A4E31_00210 [Methanomassiliicoccales archaeon PtaU1.Bin030]|nr:MAG: hypothetical protein A4E31_00210 [Methanomassiliicoccales archaeon PtaU1.Bin030]
MGISTSCDIAKALARRFIDLKDITSGSVITTSPEEPIEEAIKRIDEHEITALLVFERDGRARERRTPSASGRSSDSAGDTNLVCLLILLAVILLAVEHV